MRKSYTLKYEFMLEEVFNINIELVHENKLITKLISNVHVTGFSHNYSVRILRALMLICSFRLSNDLQVSTC